MVTSRIILLAISLSMSFMAVADVTSDAVVAARANPQNIEVIVVAAVSKDPSEAAAIVAALVTAAPHLAAAITTAAITAAPHLAAAITTAAITAAPHLANAIMTAAITIVLTNVNNNPSATVPESAINNAAIKESVITTALGNTLKACVDVQCKIDASLSALNLGGSSPDLVASLAGAIVRTVIAITDPIDTSIIVNAINNAASPN